MSLTRKAPTAPKKHGKLRRQDLAQALVEREAELAEARGELQESLQQRIATVDVLKAISRSAFDLDTVLETLISTALRLCNAKHGQIFRRYGDVYRYAASQMDVDPAYRQHEQATEIRPGRGTLVGRVALENRTVEIADAWNDPEYAEKDEARLGGVRAMLGVPLIRDGEPIGAFALARSEPIPFSQRQIELVTTFADQAVIAIENARLVNETKKALERQTATADILKIIAASPADVQPVFDAIAACANRLIGGFSTTVLRFVGDALQLVAFTPLNPEADQALKASHPRPVTEFPPFELVRNGESVEFADTESEDVPPFNRELARLRGYRSTLHTPLMSDGAAIGMVIVTRKEPGAFAADDVKLLRTFADQAVIAINNVGLFNETQEALQQQTATAEVLKVISRSAFDLQTVLDTLVGSAVALCDASGGMIYLKKDDAFYGRAFAGYGGEFIRYLESSPQLPGRRSVGARVLLTGEVQNIRDLRTDQEYDPHLLATTQHRAVLGVPLLRDKTIVGAIVVGRANPEAFTQREIELVATFADQAVIAIENVRLFDEVQAKTCDLEEALQQQTATANVLKVISRSTFDLRSVWRTLVESASALCGAPMGLINLRDGDVFRVVTQKGYGEAFERYLIENPLEVGPYTATGRAAGTGAVSHIPDVLQDPDYKFAEGQRLAGYRAALAVPLLREDTVIGVFFLARPTPGPFTERQIELVQTFADQAVIAIANARLFDEVQAKTRDLEEALQQQTATADVLKVISRSAFDLQAVLDTLVRSATELCNAHRGVIFLRHGNEFRFQAAFGHTAEALRGLRGAPLLPTRATAAGRILLSGELQHIPDVREDKEFVSPLRGGVEASRALLGVPLKRERTIVGAIILGRPRTGQFSERQIELVQTFADQAVIAIENARLFNEVQAKTRDLEEALQQQTATADVLKVISRSAFDLQAVWRTLVESASTLCEAPMGLIELLDGDVFRMVMQKGYGEAFERYLLENPLRAGSSSGTGRAASTGEVSHIPDVLEDPHYLLSEAQRLGGYRSNLAVPLLRENKVIGVFVLCRPTPGPFTERQIELVKTFADQAVIAIENVRLFDEVQARTRDLSEALAQQTATADVLKVISRSVFDLQNVLDTLMRTAAELCEVYSGGIAIREGDAFRYAAFYGSHVPDAYKDLLRATPVVAGRATMAGRVALEGKVVHVADLSDDPDYKLPESVAVAKIRTCLGVPLLRDGTVVGVLVVNRSRVEPFSARQIELLQTFADQAVVAIENARLFAEVKAKTRDLEEALGQQTATADVLKVISRSAFDLQAVLTTLAESAKDLCGASFVTLSLRDGDAMLLRAESGCTPEIIQFMRAHPIRAGRETFTGRVMLSGEPVHLPDVLADREYDFGEGPQIGNYRALLAVPLLREGRVEGVFALARPEPTPFTDRQIEMVRAFADQAVIAIENSRLFEQVQSRTRELAASLDDLRKAQDRLIQSEKLASLGQLTAGIAHEIKNPLNFINNYSALSCELVDELADAIKAAPLDKAKREEADELVSAIGGNLDKVVQHGKRADSIVKNMLLHSRQGSGERSMTNINAMVEEALNLAYHGARAEKPGFNVTIAKSLDPNAGAAEVYAQEMTRVLLNVISNGFYATTKRQQSRGDGAYEPKITASTRDLGPNVEIAIRDNGTGISDEVKTKMFHPFFTTKPAGEGTGLGLSLSHDIVVKQHGGTIEVSTEPGAFTQFTIVLPRGEAGA
jgi:GAF domain-containing protein